MFTSTRDFETSTASNVFYVQSTASNVFYVHQFVWSYFQLSKINVKNVES